MYVRVACGAVVAGPLFLATSIGPFTPQRPPGWKIAFPAPFVVGLTLGAILVFRFLDSILGNR